MKRRHITSVLGARGIRRAPAQRARTPRAATQEDLLLIAAAINDAYGLQAWAGDVKAIIDDRPRNEFPPRVEQAVLAEALERGLLVADPTTTRSAA